eukprot:scaffold108112_cov75-Phaeocystis_antarctica.AAC.4
MSATAASPSPPPSPGLSPIRKPPISSSGAAWVNSRLSFAMDCRCCASTCDRATDACGHIMLRVG